MPPRLRKLLDLLDNELNVLQVQGTAAGQLLAARKAVQKLRDLQIQELDELENIDRELGIMRVKGTAVGPLMNSKGIMAEIRRVFFGEFDEKKDTSEMPKLDKDE